MIRHVAVMTLKEGADVRRLVSACEALRRVPGPTSLTFGVDAGLKTGNAQFAVCADFADETTYRAWDTNADHDGIRREMVFPHVSNIARCQFRV